MQGEYSDLFEQVLKQIGINILVLQQVEKGLKLIIPYISHPNAGTNDIDDIRKQKESVKKQTLGSLVNIFLKSADYDSDYFAELLIKIVDERNKLVHHFGEQQGLNILSNEESCKNCLTHLKAQHQEIIFFYKEIRLYVSTVCLLMKKSYGKPHPQLERLYNELRQSIISDGVEYINLLDPSDTAWVNTRIVKLLQLAELNTEKTDDMTSLAKAGEFIKKIAPECTPKEYGVKNLKEVLKVSDLFEVREIQDSQHRSILYKSKT